MFSAGAMKSEINIGDTSVHMPVLLEWSSALFLVEGEQWQPEFLKAKRKHDLTKCHT